MYFQIFLIVIGVGAIALSFYNPHKKRYLNNPENDSLYGYGRFGLPFRLFYAGLLCLIILLVSLFPSLKHQSSQIIGIILFCLGIVVLVGALLIRFSERVENMVWMYITPSKYPKRDRNQLFANLLVMVFGLFFGFYVFFWG
jgi:hypothetical protein